MFGPLDGRRHPRRPVLLATAVVALAGLAILLTLERRPATRHPDARHGPATSRIKHIVFMIEENRSYDNVFGRYPGADGATTATDVIGRHRVTAPLAPEPYYLWHDLGHDLYDAQVATNRGQMDGFSHETYSNLFGDRAAFQQLAPADIPNLYAYARHFTLSDHTFASVAGPTLPNHLHAVAAQDGGVISNPQNASNAWGCDALKGAYVLQQSHGRLVKSAPCFSFATLADSLNRARLSWAYYAAPPSDFGYIWSTLDAIKPIRESAQWRQNVRDERDFARDARAGRLPAFSWLTPSAATSMHPPVPVCPGENWIVQNVDAVMQGPDWSSTLIVLAWDDWGGYYDHVAPPPAAAGSYGIRVPLLLISPFARRGHVTHTLYTFESVLKTAERVWHLRALTRADSAAHDLFDSLDFAHASVRPFLLRPRACPPPLTAARYRALLDTQLRRVLSQGLDLPPATIDLLHRTHTLAQIATMRHVDPSGLERDLKTAAAAWAGGKVMLGLVGPLQANPDTYTTLVGIGRAFTAQPGAPPFATPR